jgi:hypothetical protein
MAFGVSIQLIDDYGRTTTRRYENTQALAADALTDVAALIVDFLAVSDLGTVKHDICVATVAANGAQSGANKDVGGTLHVRLNNGKLYPLKIPGIKDAMLNADGSIKIDDEDVIAYVANFLTGGTFRVSEGNYVTDIVSGELDG